MDFIPEIRTLRILLVLLCGASSSAEKVSWLWSRDALSEATWSCGSVIRPKGGGQQPEVFRFNFQEASSESLWRRANQVAPAEAVKGECAVALVSPKASSRLAVGVDSVAAEGGGGQCLSGNDLALYDLQGGRLLLKDAICGWQKTTGLMESSGSMVLITVNLRNLKKGNFLLKVSVLGEGSQHISTTSDFLVPPTAATPEKYQEHTDVFLVPQTTSNPLSPGELQGGQTIEWISETTNKMETTTLETSTEDEGGSGTDEGYNPLEETTIEEGVRSTTAKYGQESGGSGIEFIIPSRPDRDTTKFPGNTNGFDNFSGADVRQTTANGSGGTGGSGIEFFYSTEQGDRRTTTDNPEDSGIEFLIPSASGEGRTTARPGGSGIEFVYPSGHGVGRTTANYPWKPSGVDASISLGPHTEEQTDFDRTPTIPTQSTARGVDVVDMETPEVPLSVGVENGEMANSGSTLSSNQKETEYVGRTTKEPPTVSTPILEGLGNTNKEIEGNPHSEGQNTLEVEIANETSRGTTSMPSGTSTIVNPSSRPHGSGIEFVYPGRPAFALVSEKPLLFSDFPIFPQTNEQTTTQSKDTTRRPQESGIVFIFNDEPSTIQHNGELARAFLERGSSNSTDEFTTQRQAEDHIHSTSPPKRWPTPSERFSWRKRISTLANDSQSNTEKSAGDGLPKEIFSIPRNSTEMTPENSTGSNSETVESDIARMSEENLGWTLTTNLLREEGLQSVEEAVNTSVAKDTSQETNTTDSQKRDLWSGIQLVIPRKSVTPSPSEDPPHVEVSSMSSLAYTRPSLASTTATTADRHALERTADVYTVIPSVTDSHQSIDRTLPAVSSTEDGIIIEDRNLQTSAFA